MTRHFLISYLFTTEFQSPCFGSITINTTGGHVSCKMIENEVTQAKGAGIVSIISLYEFPSKKDFDQFTSQEPLKIEKR